jgi:ATPase subunit of ABC transporter with duplicated ATPase domains
LVLDEPFNTLDVDAREVLQEGLRARAEAGGINILSAHDRALEEGLEAWVVEVRGGQAKPLRRDRATKHGARG